MSAFHRCGRTFTTRSLPTSVDGRGGWLLPSATASAGKRGGRLASAPTLAGLHASAWTGRLAAATASRYTTAASPNARAPWISSAAKAWSRPAAATRQARAARAPLAHQQLSRLDRELPIDIALLVLIHPDGGVGTRGVHTLNLADDLLAERGTGARAAAALGCGAPASSALRGARSGRGSGCRALRTGRLSNRQQPELLAGNRVVPLLAEVFAVVEQVHACRQQVVVLAGIQHQRPRVLIAAKDEFFLFFAEGLLPPCRQHRGHAHAEHGNHDQQHDHREAAVVQS